VAEGKVLNEADFLGWCARLGLTEQARATVAAVRSLNPSRRVGGGRRNVSGRYPSRKMGMVIQFESHRVELPFIYEVEHDPQVLEYYDQPPSIPLAYPALNGKRLSVMHTPDYFVLREDSAGWVECKTPEDLEKLATCSPHRYLRDSDGNWRCVPGEAYASAMGLSYTVWSSAQVNWVLQRNLQFLEDYLRLTSLDAAEVANPAIKTAVEAEPGMFLSELLEKVRGIAEPDEIYFLIASGSIYIDLNAAAIAEPDRVRVFANAEIAKACELAQPDINKSAVNCGAAGSPFAETLTSRTEAFRFLAAASELDLAAANRRFDFVKRHLAGENLSPSVPARTIRLWAAKYRLAKEQYGNGYVGLLPKTNQRGNRTHRLPTESRDLLVQFVENDYENLKQKTKVASWAALKHKCEESCVVAPSYVTFCTAVQNRSAFEQVSKRQGHRAAYTHAAFHFELERTTPRGSPFRDRAH
jgi:putative transposase